MKYTLVIYLALFGSGLFAAPNIDTTAHVHDALIRAMSSRSLEMQSQTESNQNDSQSDSNNTCLWGGWISSRDSQGRCQPAFRLDVYNDPFIKSFGQTYNASMRCGAENLYRCNPTIFGKGTGRDARGFCVNLPSIDSALLMTACREAAAPSAPEHLKRMQTDAELLAQYINQAAQIALQCQQNGDSCAEFVEAISKDVKPALECHPANALFPYMSSTLSNSNMEMIDQLTGSLASEYNEHIAELLKNRNAAIEHNQSLLEQAIKQYGESDEVRRMNAKLEQNFKVHYDKYRTNIGSKRKQASVGRCLMYAKLALISGGFFSQYPSEFHAKDFGSHLTGAGFTNLMDTPGYKDITPETSPVGAVIVYEGGPSGHIEMKMPDGGYGSDHWNDVPIKDYLNRTPIGIYVKIDENVLNGLVEVPNE